MIYSLHTPLSSYSTLCICNILYMVHSSFMYIHPLYTYSILYILRPLQPHTIHTYSTLHGTVHSPPYKYPLFIYMYILTPYSTYIPRPIHTLLFTLHINSLYTYSPLCILHPLYTPPFIHTHSTMSRNAFDSFKFLWG